MISMITQNYRLIFRITELLVKNRIPISASGCFSVLKPFLNSFKIVLFIIIIRFFPIV